MLCLRKEVQDWCTESSYGTLSEYSEQSEDSLEMAEQRRQTHSTRTRRQTQQSDAQFWNSQPDPVLIERGQTQAVQLVRDMINPTSTTGDVIASNTTGVLVYIDEEGLEEQFLTKDEASQEVLDITANRVTTPVVTVMWPCWIPFTHKDLNRKPNWTCNRPEDQRRIVW